MEKDKINSAIAIFMVTLVTICFSNCTSFRFFYKMTVTWFLLILAGIVIFKGKLQKPHQGVDYYLLLIGMIIVNYIFSPYKSEVYIFLIVFAFGFFLYFIRLERKEWKFFITVCFVFVCFIAITILIEPFFPTFNSDHLWFLGTINRSEISALREFKKNEIQIMAYSGVAFEKADAAYYMVIGICYLSAKYRALGSLNKKEWFCGFLFLACIILTGKRMLILCAAVVILVVFSLTRDNNKVLKIIGVSIVSLIGVMILAEVVPSVQHLVDRFINASTGQDVALLERYLKWENAIKLFERKSFIGYGYGSYNKAALEVGYNASFYVHNIYIQLLSDTGLIGTFIFIIFAVVNLYRVWHFLRYYRYGDKDCQFILTFSLAVQILILVYGFSGNTLFYTAQLFMYLLSTIMANRVMDEIHRGKMYA